MDEADRILNMDFETEVSYMCGHVRMCVFGCTCGKRRGYVWVKRERVDEVILCCNSSPLPLPLPPLPLPPPGGQDSEGSSSSACDLPLLSHHDQEGAEAPASLSA